MPPRGGRKHPQQEYTKIDTNNILFICGGAFGGIEDIVTERLGAKKVGFGFGARNEEQISVHDLEQDRIYEHVLPDDLVQYGLISEFIGRIPVVTSLETLSEEALLSVLTEPKGSLTQQYQKLFEVDGIVLTFTDCSLRAIAKEAISRGTGARGLRAILETAMTDIMFAAPTDKSIIQEIIINEDVIIMGLAPQIVYKAAKSKEKTVENSCTT